MLLLQLTGRLRAKRCSTAVDLPHTAEVIAIQNGLVVGHDDDGWGDLQRRPLVYYPYTYIWNDFYQNQRINPEPLNRLQQRDELELGQDHDRIPPVHAVVADDDQPVYVALRQQAQDRVALVFAASWMLERRHHEDVRDDVDVGDHDAFLLTSQQEP